MGTVTGNISEATCVFRRTGGRIGRNLVIAPQATPMRYLHYARIAGTATSGPVEFDTAECEAALICLTGRAFVVAADDLYELTPYDALYVPPGIDVRVDADGVGCDLAEVGAPVEGDYRVQFVPFSEVQAEEETHILIGDNVEAGRIAAGVSFDQPGKWRSSPLREGFEQAQLYIDMPGDTWGIQMVCAELARPEILAMVRRDDCVLIPRGHSLSVAGPGARLGFLWMRAAHLEGADRRLGILPARSG